MKAPFRTRLRPGTGSPISSKPVIRADTGCCSPARTENGSAGVVWFPGTPEVQYTKYESPWKSCSTAPTVPRRVTAERLTSSTPTAAP